MARLNISLDPKLTDSVISVFHSRNIYTVFDFVSEDSVKIMQYSDLTYQEILEIKRKITNLYIGGITKGSELLKISNNVIRTEIGSLDNLLKGGLLGGEIYEICGLSSAGKSQLCHTIAVNITQKLNGIVHYVDTKGDFCAKRTHAIIKSKNLNENQQCLVLDSIMVTRIEVAEELMTFLHNLVKELKIKTETNRSIKLIVIDSLPAIFFNSNTELSSLAQTLNYFSNVLKCVVNEYNIPVITINLITQWRECNFVTIGSDNTYVRKPMLGKYWISIPNTRLFVETMACEERRITVWKSSRLASGSNCKVRITNEGVV